MSTGDVANHNPADSLSLYLWCQPREWAMTKLCFLYNHQTF